MNSEKLFYYDSYITDFEATILEVRPMDKKFAIVLDKTYFYPESGGQPADIGTINGINVLHVSEKQGEILHMTETSLEVGPAVCKIDWNKRFDSMQQHSGQHILSACFYKLFQGETSSFTIGKESTTIEIDLQSFDNDMAEQIEDMANGIIYMNSTIKTDIVDKEQLSKLPLRKQPKVESNIRIVDMAGCDCTPCGGTHVKSTGEIGMIKIKRYEKHKNSHKFEFVCGSRALKDYSYKNAIVNKLGVLLSAPEHNVEGAFVKYMDDYKNLQKQMSNLRSQLISYDVQKLLGESLQVGNFKIIRKVFEDRDFNDIKLMAQTLTAESGYIVLLASQGDNLQLMFTRSDDLDINMGNLLKSVLPAINGKGGGSGKAAQGGGTGDAEMALNVAIENLTNL